MIINPSHPLLHLSNDFIEICKPLQMFHVNHLTFVKQYHDGSRITLCNKPQWIVDYYNLNLFDSSLFENSISHFSSGHCLWLGDYDLAVYKHGRNYYNTAHSITITEVVNDGCEFYFFAFPEEHTQSAIYLSNHMDILYHFILHFKGSRKKLLQQAEQHRLWVLTKNDIAPKNPSLQIYQNMDEIKKAFYEATPIQNFTFESGKELGIQLTSRETQCAAYLLENKTAKEIALQIGISYRTVEIYLEKIKQKLNCRSKIELLSKLQAHRLFHAIN